MAKEPLSPNPSNRPASVARPIPAKRPLPTAVPAAGRATAAKARPAADAQADDEDDYEQEGGSGFSRFLVFNAVPSWLTSMLVHIILLLILAVCTFGVGDDNFRNHMTVKTDEEPVEDIQDLEQEKIEELKVDDADIEPVQLAQDEVDPEEPIDTDAADLDAAPAQVELDPLGEDTAPRNDLLTTLGAYMGSGLSGRGAAQRGRLVRSGGGSKESEAAVAAALKWFVAHQNGDGSWSFDHTKGPCQGRCGNPGTIPEARNGATAMALLPFLGAGQTHKEGDYRKQVEAGLAWLVRHMDKKGGLNEPGGRMYSHGIAAIVLCEAYGMTLDKQLLAPAQAALNFIKYAQDPVGGGWRYEPKQKGDTSVVGWQLMALKSGHMAYLMVDRNTVDGATKFLDSVQAESGARYGYTGPGSGEATTAIGLLCRMYLGWKHDNPALQRGVAFLDQQGPSHSNMYYNYYATQVMRHYEGEQWKRWNARMRDWLVSQQATKGHETGSWYIGGGHGNRGGRVYCTSMATMILEVYYRHLPIFRKKSVEEDFPL